MSKWIELEPGVYTAPQLVEEDFADVAKFGFKSVVNNRPDGEAESQLPDLKAAAMAQALGLNYHYQPVANLNITDDKPVASFQAHLENLPRPLLFYCRSGTRCTLLWAQASAKRLGVDRVIEMAAQAGYSIDVIREVLEMRAED